MAGGSANGEDGGDTEVPFQSLNYSTKSNRTS